MSSLSRADALCWALLALLVISAAATDFYCIEQQSTNGAWTLRPSKMNPIENLSLHLADWPTDCLIIQANNGTQRSLICLDEKLARGGLKGTKTVTIDNNFTSTNTKSHISLLLDAFQPCKIYGNYSLAESTVLDITNVLPTCVKSAPTDICLQRSTVIITTVSGATVIVLLTAILVCFLLHSRSKKTFKISGSTKRGNKQLNNMVPDWRPTRARQPEILTPSSTVLPLHPTPNVSLVNPDGVYSYADINRNGRQICKYAVNTYETINTDDNDETPVTIHVPNSMQKAEGPDALVDGQIMNLPNQSVGADHLSTAGFPSDDDMEITANDLYIQT